MSKTPLSPEEKSYYEDCKEYYRLTKQPLISVADEVFDKNTAIPSACIKFGIDEDPSKFDLGTFLGQICDKLKLKNSDIKVEQIQTGSAIIQADLFDKFEASDKKLSVQMVVDIITDEFKKLLGKMKVFFMYLGPIKSLLKRQQYRAKIRLNPKYNHIYGPGHNHWQGPCDDGKNRGDKPYYCPVGWQRWSFYVTDNFDAKFSGWCICYHGTKFEYGLSILLSGLKPAERAEHGAGVYTTPSINYACHPRYSEVKPIEPSSESKFFKAGKYVQFVLECRVHPHNIEKVRKETLGGENTTIDPNIENQKIEWVVDAQDKDVVDFNDPKSSIVCTGILLRVTDTHPGLLPESDWWFDSHLCKDPECCKIGIGRDSLKKQKQHGSGCNIITV